MLRKDSMTVESNSPYILQSVSNTLDIIELLGKGKALSVPELAKQSGLGKSSVFRIIATLEDKHFVTSSPDKKYSLSIKFASFRLAAMNYENVLELVHPALEKLTAESGETTHFAVLEDQINVSFVDKVVSKATIHMDSYIGFKRPAHLVACGKAILAFSGEEAWDYYMKNAQFITLTENSIGSPEELEKELKKIHEDGDSLDRQESEIGLSCVAAPIISINNKPIGAISISGPTYRMKQNIEKNIGLITAQAAEISKTLKTGDDI